MIRITLDLADIRGASNAWMQGGLEAVKALVAEDPRGLLDHAHWSLEPIGPDPAHEHHRYAGGAAREKPPS
jgi:hypothetical protein